MEPDEPEIHVIRASRSAPLEFLLRYIAKPGGVPVEWLKDELIPGDQVLPAQNPHDPRGDDSA